MTVDFLRGDQTVVSAPGKVLMAGGYLVLDQAYSGLVVATSSRFYCIIDSQPASPSTSGVAVTVQAGQFPKEQSIWSYSLEIPKNGRLELKPVDERRNKFVEITLAKALEVALESLMATHGDRAGLELEKRVKGDGSGLRIVVLADNDFYSQRETLASLGLPNRFSSLSSLQPFSPLPRPIHKTNKTGLGSSAALVTSLTAAILHHLNIVTLPSTSLGDNSTASCSPSTSLDLIHTLSQLSHCLAQGKVGSGFDISSAVYGTHTYRRFNPSILAPLLSTPSTPEFLLPHLDPSKWDTGVTPFRLPKGLRLLLADVDAGTDTPSFVGNVLKWREREGAVAKDLWDKLGEANDGLGMELKGLCDLEKEEVYDADLSEAGETWISDLRPGRPVHDSLIRIRAAIKLIRKHLQEMTRLSGVPIEPVEQTRLLDRCCSLSGVIGGGVPGAGGFDAIFLLIIDTPTVIEEAEQLWVEWSELSVCPLKARQSDGGLRLETVQEVPGLREALSR